MRKVLINHPIRTALIISGVYFLINVLLMKDYGISWDFHYHHYAGLYHLGLPVPSLSDPPPVPFSPPDPRLTINDPFGPFTQILPTVSYLLFFERLHLLPFDSAYNLPMVLFGSMGVGLLYLVMHDLFGPLQAWLAAVFLALLPVHVAYLHTDMKDVPNAFAFTLSVYLFWRLMRHGRLKDLIWAVLAFAFAFNVKINSILIPVVCAVYAATQIQSTKSEIRNKFKNQKEENSKQGLEHLNFEHLNLFRASCFGFRIYTFLYFILAPVAAVALWWPFWEQPWKKLLELPVFYSQNTLNMPVLFFGTMYRSGVNIPWYYPFGYIAVTTPLPVLFGLLVGFIAALKGAWKRSDRMVFLLIWFIVPIARYITPKTAAIDGVRHFLEVVYPLCAIAAVGIVQFYMSFPRRRESSSRSVLDCRVRPDNDTLAIRIIGILLLLSLLWTNIKYHPYQASFFNSLIGGIQGAQGKFDIDFWGTPQKEAVAWINEHAPSGAAVHIVMAQSSAAMYLRPDLLTMANAKSKEESNYTVLLNRESFFDLYSARPYLDEAKANHRVVFTRVINDVPLVWVIKNR